MSDGKQMADRGRRDQIAGRMADDLLVSGAAGLEIGLGRGERRQRLSATGFGLRHVGARHLADIETVLGRLELLGQHGDVVLAQANDGRVAHNIDVSGRGIEQDRLFDGAKRLTGCLHLRLRLPDGVEVLEALEQRLGQLHRPTAGVAGALWECEWPDADAGVAFAVASGSRPRCLCVGRPCRRSPR